MNSHGSPGTGRIDPIVLEEVVVSVLVEVVESVEESVGSIRWNLMQVDPSICLIASITVSTFSFDSPTFSSE